jgi:hypothetical protein
MRRKTLMFVLAIGAVAGFASGIFGCRFHGGHDRRAFEDHIADVCMRAAERSRAPGAHPENTP